MSAVATLFWTSFALLLLTKAADVVTTWRHVGVHDEANPFAAALFRRFGLAGGILIVVGLYLVLACGQYLLVWHLGGDLLLLANSLLGLFIAAIQWDVARFNTTRRPSWVTTWLLQLSARAAAWLERR